MPTGARTAFVGPTALLLYKQYGIEGGILFPAYQPRRPIPREVVEIRQFFRQGTMMLLVGGDHFVQRCKAARRMPPSERRLKNS